MSSPSPPPTPESETSKYGIAGAYVPTRPTKRMINDYRYRNEPAVNSWTSSSKTEHKSIYDAGKLQRKFGDLKKYAENYHAGTSSTTKYTLRTTSNTSIDTDSDLSSESDSEIRKRNDEIAGAEFDRKIESRKITPFLGGGKYEQLLALKEIVEAVPEPPPPPKEKIYPWDIRNFTQEEDPWERYERIKEEIRVQKFNYRGCYPPDNYRPKLEEIIIPTDKRLSTKFKTKLDKIRDEVVAPGRYLPAPWPIWKDLDLNQKVPYFHDSFPVNVTRGKLGQRLAIDSKNIEFDLSDPYNRTKVPYQKYNALHDPHSQRYLKLPHVRRQLIAQGLLTIDDDVICSLKDLNDYRRYVKGFEDAVVLDHRDALVGRKMQKKETIRRVRRFHLTQMESERQAFKRRNPTPDPEAEIFGRHLKREAIRKKLDDAQQRKEDYIRQQDEKFFKYREREKAVYSRRLGLKSDQANYKD